MLQGVVTDPFLCYRYLMKEHPHYDLLLTEDGEVFRNGRRLSPHPTERGWLRVSFRWEGKIVRRRVHRLVMETFHPIKGKMDVNHKDGDKTNNSLSNLEWVTKQQNMAHSAGHDDYLTRPPSRQTLWRRRQCKEM